MAEDKRGVMPHNLILENRSHCEISGVTDIDSFSEESIIAYTDFGEVCILGKALHIDKLSIESGQLTLDGEISSVTYYDQRPKEKSLLGKLFK